MIRAWLQLFRLPNLLTVPGDPIAGALLTGAVVDWRTAAASLCFYMAGLAGNDIADAAEDARERPDRPIPSGRISRMAALVVALALALAGLALAYMTGHLLIGMMLLTAIAIYNLGLKHIVIVGPTVMGLCRGLSLLLGASGLPWQAAGLVALYITVVTVIARRETSDRPVGFVRWAPAIVLAAGFVVVLKPLPLPVLCAGVAVLLAILGGRALSPGLSAWPSRGAKYPVPPVIGLWISAMLPIQAALAAAGSAIAAIILLACWPVFRVLSRLFYAS